MAFRKPAFFMAVLILGGLNVTLAPVSPVRGAVQESSSIKEGVKKNEETPSGRLRKEYLQEKRLNFSYARSLRVVMPPLGNIKIEGWTRRELLIQAKMVVEANTEPDLETLAKNIGFSLVQDEMTWELISVGPQIKIDKKKEREQLKKGLPSNLTKLPYRIDYTLRVPEYTDLDIQHINGEVVLASMYGNVDLVSQRCTALFSGLGGNISGQIATGEARVEFVGRSWRGAGIDLQMGSGNIVLDFPKLYSADLSLSASQPLEVNYPISRGENEAPNTPIGRQLTTRLGVGGARMKFSTLLGRISVVAANTR